MCMCRPMLDALAHIKQQGNVDNPVLLNRSGMTGSRSFLFFFGNCCSPTKLLEMSFRKHRNFQATTLLSFAPSARVSARLSFSNACLGTSRSNTARLPSHQSSSFCLSPLSFVSSFFFSFFCLFSIWLYNQEVRSARLSFRVFPKLKSSM